MASAAILAGGRAARFGGRDKTTLIVNGRTILDRQLHELSRLTNDILIVGGRQPSYERAGLGVRQTRDRTPGLGPLAGIDAALSAARDPVVLVLACDMPFVTAPFLQHLVLLVSDVDAVVPRTKRGYHPLCAVYTRACQAAIQSKLSAGRLAVSDLLADVRVRLVAPWEIEVFGNPDYLLANINSPAQLQELEALQGH